MDLGSGIGQCHLGFAKIKPWTADFHSQSFRLLDFFLRIRDLLFQIIQLLSNRFGDLGTRPGRPKLAIIVAARTNGIRLHAQHLVGRQMDPVTAMAGRTTGEIQFLKAVFHLRIGKQAGYFDMAGAARVCYRTDFRWKRPWLPWQSLQVADDKSPSFNSFSAWMLWLHNSY